MMNLMVPIELNEALRRASTVGAVDEWSVSDESVLIKKGIITYRVAMQSALAHVEGMVRSAQLDLLTIPRN